MGIHEMLELVEQGLAVVGVLKQDIPTLNLLLLGMGALATSIAVYRYKMKCEKVSCETAMTAAKTIEAMSKKLDKATESSEKNVTEISDLLRDESKEIQTTLRSMSSEMLRMSYVHIGLLNTHKKRKDIKHEE